MNEEQSCKADKDGWCRTHPRCELNKPLVERLTRERDAAVADRDSWKRDAHRRADNEAAMREMRDAAVARAEAAEAREEAFTLSVHEHYRGEASCPDLEDACWGCTTRLAEARCVVLREALDDKTWCYWCARITETGHREDCPYQALLADTAVPIGGNDES